MKSTAVILGMLTLSSCATDQSYIATKRGRVTNYEAKGNLQSLNPLKGPNLSAVTNQNTPADIFPAVRKCIAVNDYDQAAMLFAVAAVYGRFDMQRVEDETAHQAVQVLQFSAFHDMNEDQNAKLAAAIKQCATPSSPEHDKLCAFLKTLKPPNYFPAYMIQHGMGAFSKSPAYSLVKDFDSAKAWASSLGYVNCGS